MTCFAAGRFLVVRVPTHSTRVPTRVPTHSLVFAFASPGALHLRKRGLIKLRLGLRRGRCICLGLSVLAVLLCQGKPQAVVSRRAVLHQGCFLVPEMHTCQKCGSLAGKWVKGRGVRFEEGEQANSHNQQVPGTGCAPMSSSKRTQASDTELSAEIAGWMVQDMRGCVKPLVCEWRMQASSAAPFGADPLRPNNTLI